MFWFNRWASKCTYLLKTSLFLWMREVSEQGTNDVYGADALSTLKK